MKKFLLLTIAGSFSPIIALAQSWNNQISDDGYAYASAFTGNFSLLLSIVIGAIATFIVFRAAKKLGGGLFGLVLNYIGIAVAFIVLGSIATIVNPWHIGFDFNIASTVFYALGYIFTVIGANKLLKGIMNT